MKTLAPFIMSVLVLVVLTGCQSAHHNSSIIGFWRHKANDNECYELLFTPDQVVYYIFRSMDNKVTIARTGSYKIINGKVRMEYPEGIPNLFSGGVKTREVIEDYKVDGGTLFFGNDRFEKIYSVGQKQVSRDYAHPAPAEKIEKY